MDEIKNTLDSIDLSCRGIDLSGSEKAGIVNIIKHLMPRGKLKDLLTKLDSSGLKFAKRWLEKLN